MKPYHKLLLLVLFLELSVTGFAQSSSDSVKINFIKTQYVDINKNLKSYKRLVKTDTIETTEGNEVVLFFKGTEIKKITATYYGETGKKVNEYYFFNKKLIFSYNADYHYTVPINVNDSKVASKKEKRYYFNDSKIFLIKGDPIGKKAEINSLSTTTQKDVERLINLKDIAKN